MIPINLKTLSVCIMTLLFCAATSSVALAQSEASDTTGGPPPDVGYSEGNGGYVPSDTLSTDAPSDTNSRVPPKVEYPDADEREVPADTTESDPLNNSNLEDNSQADIAPADTNSGVPPDVEYPDADDREAPADTMETEIPGSVDDGSETSALLSGDDGDYDGDGKLGVSDLLLMLKAISSGEPQYDLNQDGECNVFDLLELLKKLSGRNTGNGGTGLAAVADAPRELCFPDGSVLSVPSNYNGTGLADISSSGELAGELLQQARSMLSSNPAQQVKLPRAFTLAQNSPNPFNPSTTIQYDIPEGNPVHTSLTVHNVRGQVVNVLVNSMRSPGSYQVQWDGRDRNGRKVSSGIYFYSIKTDGFSATRKMIMLK
jgi:hypothetical protein